MENNTFNVAVMGAGNIGSAVISRLMNLDKGIVELNVKRVLVKDKSKKRDISNEILTENFDDILNDDSIDLVIEVLGGVDPGKEYIKALLQNGKGVITANKDIIAHSGSDLINIAKENNACLYFEAAVAAGIPVLKPIIESLRGEELTKVSGINKLSYKFILIFFTMNLFMAKFIPRYFDIGLGTNRASSIYHNIIILIGLILTTLSFKGALIFFN